VAPSSSPSVEEMERMLGIDTNSPGAMEMFNTTAASSMGANKNLPKKSIRRTTMLSSEIRDTLKDVRNLAVHDPDRRRSSRLDGRTVNYGSPSGPGKKEDGFKHPLAVKENWKVAEGRQKIHNQNVLTIINTANASMLTKLPAVGPKSAYILIQYRDVHKEIKTIEEIKNIPGLSKNFFDKFCRSNQLKIEQDVEASKDN